LLRAVRQESVASGLSRKAAAVGRHQSVASGFSRKAAASRVLMQMHDASLSATSRQAPLRRHAPLFLTFCPNRKEPFFAEPAKVELVQAQFLRAGSEVQFALTAYCFMPDHMHLIATGLAEDADVKKFIVRAKQYSGFYFKREFGISVWQRYGFDRVIRDDMELACTIGYIVANPVGAGLVSDPLLYAYLGSTRFEVTELLEMGECDRRLTQPSA